MTPTPLDLLAGVSRRVPEHRPWPRAVVDKAGWHLAARALERGELTLLGLWGDAGVVHMALLDEGRREVAVVTNTCPDGRFPSVGALHTPAIRLERAIRDLWGLEPDGAPDPRPWLDHGRWPVRAPLGMARARSEGKRPSVPGNGYPFLPVEGDDLHQIPVGPVHAGIIEPGHFRFTQSGEAVVRLEERLGYAHKGIESLLTGASLDAAARLVGHVSGDSTVAYQIAFARAVETALGWEVPARAVWLRALMAELERLANHLGDIGAIFNDAAFAILHANCQILREQVLRASETGFGHRLMMDRIVPGGLASDVAPDGPHAVGALLGRIRPVFDELMDVYDNSPSMLERAFGTGILAPSLAQRFGCGGIVGRSSLRGFDARKTLPYAPYDQLSFEVPVMNSGDVNARLWVRAREVQQSLGLVQQILARLPDGAVAPTAAAATQPRAAVEGMALVEGFRGDVLAWVRLGPDLTVERCHLRDPSWFQWPVLEAAIEGNIIADFPLCNKSFNCSYSGHDL